MNPMKLFLAIAASMAALPGGVESLRSADCNRNGVEDALDLLPHDFRLFAGRRYASFPIANDTLDAWDVNGDGKADLVGSGGSVVLLARDKATFQIAAHLGAADSPVIAADLNGDDDLDLATIHPNSGTVSVLLNQGGDAFEGVSSYPVGRYPAYLLQADLNGDSRPDLATIGSHEESGHVSVLLNAGEGVFKDADSYPVGRYPGSLIAADLDGDGMPELSLVISACPGCTPGVPGSVAVLTNRGDGSFMGPLNYGSFENGPYGAVGSNLTAADLNGDGELDLSVTRDGSVSTLLNRGDGTFGKAVDHSVGEGTRLLIAADLNGDGDHDLATANRDDISILLNQGDGTFQNRVDYRTRHSAGSLIAADLNTDGTMDLATDGVSILLNRRDGTFVEAVNYAGGGAGNLIAAELNGDGRPDLFLNGWVLMNRGDGGLEAARSYAFGGGCSASGRSIAADLNGDGKLDVASIGSTGESGCVSLLLNRGDGSFMDVDPSPVEGNPDFLIAADLNADGRLDLACTGVNPPGVSVLLNQGDGNFLDAVGYPVGPPALGGVTNALIAADLNSDGSLDLATSSGFVLINHGDGTFSDALSYSVRASRLPIVTDLNDDGKLDIASVYGRYCGGGGSVGGGGEHGECKPVQTGVAVLLNQGDGTFMDPVDYLVGTKGPQPTFVDLNGDGRPDLVATFTEPGNISVLMNRGDGTFTAPVDYGAEGSAMTVADLNADGRPDLVTDGGSVLLNRGDGSFSEAVHYTPEGGYLVAADLNGDGRPDLATAGAGTPGRVSVLLNRGEGSFRDALTYPVEGYPGSLTASDLDGDGKLDLITDAGSVLLNRGDGTFLDAVNYAFGGSVVVTDVDGDRDADLLLLRDGGVSVVLNRTSPPLSQDQNQDGIPDECETRFHRGDPNDDGAVDISDAIATLGFLFTGGATPPCKESADANNDGSIDISDGIFLLAFSFLGGPAPMPPGPPGPGTPCGFDTDRPGSPGDLGCESSKACP